jgi:cation/acetate symporter
MVGTAGLPHVIIRFYTVPRVRDARLSAFWALLFIAVLYTMAPAVGAFSRTHLIEATRDAYYSLPAGADATSTQVVPDWFHNWENTGLIAWVDKNGDSRIQYAPGPAFVNRPEFTGERGIHGQRIVSTSPTENANELFIDHDIMVLANPEMARLPNWVVGLVAAGGLAAALSTAAGLLLVISTAVSHDLLKRVFVPSISERSELWAARIAAALGVGLAGWLGIHPPGFVAEVVALAFGLAASTFFPVILLGIFSRRMNREGAIAGMLCGLAFTASYILYFKFLGGTSDQWFLGISPEGIGAVGMLVNFAAAALASRLGPAPSPAIQSLIEEIRVPSHAGPAHEIEVPPYRRGE